MAPAEKHWRDLRKQAAKDVCTPLDGVTKVSHVSLEGSGESDVGPQHPLGASMFPDARCRRLQGP